MVPTWCSPARATTASRRAWETTPSAPAVGAIQQLSAHIIGGVITPTPALMAITPADVHPKVEATQENKDVRFVKVGQKAEIKVEIKVEIFPFTRYGTLPGTVTSVSNDAVNDEKKGPVFLERVRLERASFKGDERAVPMTPGMAVNSEIATGKRRLISFFVDPLRKTVSERVRER